MCCVMFKQLSGRTSVNTSMIDGPNRRQTRRSCLGTPVVPNSELSTVCGSCHRAVHDVTTWCTPCHPHPRDGV
jgi:hypothetical protein